MANVPNKPIESYPLVSESERPVVPSLDPVGASGASDPTTKAEIASLPVERLAFRPSGRPLSQMVRLDYPFEWGGQLVEAITVRRLTVAEVAEIADSGDLDRLAMWAMYAAQTGMPVGVLRGLDEDDGDRVLEVARDFLPRAFRAILQGLDAAATPSRPTPPSGAPTSPG